MAGGERLQSGEKAVSERPHQPRSHDRNGSRKSWYVQVSRLCACAIFFIQISVVLFSNELFNVIVFMFTV